MARILPIRGKTLPNSTTKDDCHDLVDNATFTISDIVNADIKSDAAIDQSKLATISTIGKVNLSALKITGQTAGDILYANCRRCGNPFTYRHSRAEIKSL